MSLPVIWLPVADEDPVGIAGFIAEHDEHAALGLVHRIELAALRLADPPYIAPAGRVPGARELAAEIKGKPKKQKVELGSSDGAEGNSGNFVRTKFSAGESGGGGDDSRRRARLPAIPLAPLKPQNAG